MNILLQRDLQTNFWGDNEYVAGIHLDCNDEELTIIEQHNFYTLPLYTVPEAEQLSERSRRAFERSHARSCLRTVEATKLIADTVAGLYYSARSHLSLTITVRDALSGTTISSPNLTELLDCENIIRTSFDLLHQQVTDALAFTTAREQIYAADDEEVVDQIPPRHWANPHRILRRH